MMTQKLEMNLLEAPLAAIDRRSLSQAWYSALRLARPRECIAAPLGRSTNESSSLAKNLSKGEKRALSAQPAESRPARCRSSEPSLSAAQPGVTRIADGRVIPLSQRIERRFAGSLAPMKRATFSMGRGAARVFVVVQTNGNVATLIALCRPEMRTVVARALAAARFTLTTHGFVIDLQMPRRRCS
jgi:hypothetical protein